MMRLLTCVTTEHNPWLVLLAVAFCGLGSWSAVRLYLRARRSASLSQMGWLFLAAIATGSAVWCTHFIAMLAYRPGVPFTYDPVLTLASLLIAIGGGGAGLVVATRRFPLAGEIGGLIVGLSIIAMHFTGMRAYHLAGTVDWDPVYVAVAVAGALVFGALALRRTDSDDARRSQFHAAAWLMAAIVTLHFVAMAAMMVTPFAEPAAGSDGGVQQAMALAVAAVGLLVIGTGIASYLIEDRSRSDAYDRLRRLADSTLEGLVVTRGGHVVEVNGAMQALVGLPRDALLGRHFADEFLPGPPGDRLPASHHETTLRTAAGSQVDIELIVRENVPASGQCTYVLRDIRERRTHERRIRHLALHDSLTDLPNRASLDEHLDRELQRLADRGGPKLAVLCMDLDHFKSINDTRGHAAGDDALRAIARRISGSLERGEFVARVGGDEFIAVKRFQAPAEVVDFTYRLEAAVFQPIPSADGEMTVGASIGISVAPDDGTSRSDLLGNADLAMYRAKASPSAVVCHYHRDMDDGVRQRRALASDLRQALANGELQLHYQVQAAIANHEVCGFEALLRWNHPVRGQVPPAEFIPIAEETGLIRPIGEWVLRTACEAAVRWPRPHKVAVNLSPVQLMQPDIVAMIRDTLEQTGLAPHRLEIEITESTLIADLERTAAILREMQKLGVSVAMDDFGVGYSSLATLRAFPFNKIKIDCSFMSEFDAGPQSRAIVSAVVGLAHSLSIAVLAEGVETHEQLDFLLMEGCDEAQGYLLGHPAPAIVQLPSLGIGAVSRAVAATT
jgi:diguanylate cyclase (GGDEF)-like protein